MRDRRLLVGTATGDDAGVFLIDRDRAIVQTVDFFTPIVDDAITYGRIAAANALSDVYAMGGRPLTALNLVGFPANRVPLDVVNRILRGGASTLVEAKCVLVGGHTIRNPEPIYGLAVTGLVSPRLMLTNGGARPGDALILTKPLGTGIVTTAIKRGLAAPSLRRKAIAIMKELNTAGPDIAERRLAHAAVDITGFGLLGHLAAMCRASNVAAEIIASKIPVIGRSVFELAASGCVPGGSRDNQAEARRWTEWDGVSDGYQELLTDAQTSGGLLFSVAPRHVDVVLRRLAALHTACTAVIGAIVRGKSRIRVAA
jgi:selenide,water dikinase